MGGVLSLWREHEVEILVLLSFSLQVLLLMLSEMCRYRAVMSRRKTYATLRSILWVAYQLTDSTALYTLGHMSLSCTTKSSEDKQLMAFWAPFLLVHLGGQDTINAYSMEDNKLWKRHLLADLLVQALGAVYVLYRYCKGGWTLLAAAILMFFLSMAILMLVVGILKFGERVYSQRSSSQGNILNFLAGAAISENLDNYRLPLIGTTTVAPVPGASAGSMAADGALEVPALEVELTRAEGRCDSESCCFRLMKKKSDLEAGRVNERVADSAARQVNGVNGVAADEAPLQFHRVDGVATDAVNRVDNLEEVLQGAHDLMYICMGQFVNYKVWPSVFQGNAMKVFDQRCSQFELAVKQVSLMRDILFTKVPVIYTRAGYIIRAISVIFTVAAFILFSRSSAGRWGSPFSKEDIKVTYALLSGATLIEMISLLRLAVSTWTCASLLTGEWKRLHKAIISLRTFLGAAKSYRGWSGYIGQHDLAGFIYNVRSYHTVRMDTTSAFVRLKLWFRGLKDYFIPIKISDSEVMQNLVLAEIKAMVTACDGNQETLWGYRGQRALSQWQGFYENLKCRVEDIGFDGSILAWHIATHIFVDKCSGTLSERAQLRMHAIIVLSNYMVFLLAEVPHLLPSPARRTKCEDIRRNEQIQSEIKDGVDEYDDEFSPGGHLAWMLKRVVEKRQSTRPEVLDVIFQVWVEMLCYAAGHCSSNSHARQLSSSIEFLTIIWILTSTEYNRAYSDHPEFRAKATEFFNMQAGIFGAQPEAPAAENEAA